MDELNYEQIVDLHHVDLYRFAYSLTGSANDACELTQETYQRLFERGSQIHDESKVKSWLFTTLYRIFLNLKRRSRRFPEVPLDSVESELPVLSPTMVNRMDSQTLMEVLLEIEHDFRAPLLLFYIDDLSYREIANVLRLPIGTVMSRLSRAKHLLRERLLDRTCDSEAKIVPLTTFNRERSAGQ